MKFQGAQIREQGQSYALVVVKPQAVATSSSSQEVIAAFQPYFPGLPIVLASQDSRGRFTYYGRPDIVNFLANIDPRRIPWKEYTIS